MTQNLSRNINALNIFELLDLEKTISAIIKKEIGTSKRTLPLFELRKKIIVRLGYYAIKDPLTGLLNRTAYTALINGLIGTGAQSNKDFVHIILDTDHFKEVNDKFGHETGDSVLQHLAEVINKDLKKPMYNKGYAVILRQENPVRLGGEEIAILLPDTAIDVGISRADYLRIKISNAFLQYQNLPQITVSGGVISLEKTLEVLEAKDNELEQELKKKAIYVFSDFALYQAKKLGRNKVLGFDEALCSHLTKDSKRKLDIFCDAVLKYRKQLIKVRQKI